MPNAAYDNVTPIRPRLEVVETSRVADLDDGYTRIANELLEAVMLAGLTQHQLLVFLAVMRKTYGYSKKIDWVSNEQLSQLTGILPHKCSAAKSVLVKRGIFLQSGRTTGINKVVSEWSELPDSGKKKAAYPKRVNLPESGKESLPESGNESYPNQANTKETITKEKKENKNTMPEQARAKRGKASPRHEETDQAFEQGFWLAGMVKTGKVKARSAFETQFKAWRKETGGSAAEFAAMLAEDIRLRLGVQFGFEKLHPATYLNGQRWTDEKPAAPAAPGEQARPAITVSKTGYVFFDR